jgi:Uma2 family endonuclease
MLVMALPQTSCRLSEAEYLEIERAAEFKSELFDGEMFAMAGGTLIHSRIATNFTTELGNRLPNGPCLPFNADLRVKVMATGLFTYPDLSVICGPPQFVDNSQDTIINPTALIEVLSDSTEAYDRGKKFEHYRQIPTLREYLLVSQREPRIEQFIRQADDRWVLNEAVGLDKALELPSLKISISLREVFANVEFSPGPMRAPVSRR